MNILFICHGNICRSVMAEYIMNSLTDDFNVYSRATTFEEIGNDIYPPAKRTLERHHIKYGLHQAKRVTNEELNNSDMILVMDQENMDDIRNKFNYQKGNVYMLHAFAGTCEEISDPWYSGDFDRAYDEIYESIVGLIDFLKSDFSRRFIPFMNQYLVNGCMALITDKDKIIHSTSYGYKYRNKDLINLDTIFKVASISKVIVALGIMKLYEEGKLDIKDDISDHLGFKVRNHYYPDVPITIEMVMTQTSSLHDCGDGIKGYYGNKCGRIFVSLEDVIMNPECEYYHEDIFNNTVPGSTYEYCNLGCGILCCIIEKHSGMIFNEYIKKNILNPLGIFSGFRVEDYDGALLANHYGYRNGKFYLIADYEGFGRMQVNLFSLGNNYCGSAGGLYISPRNLSRIMMMLMNDGIYDGVRLFKEETMKFMKEVHWQGDSYDNAYKKKGLQLLILDGYGKTLRGHFGNANGLRAFMLFNEDNGFIFVCNGGNYLSDEEHLTVLLNDVLRFMTTYILQEDNK